MSLYLNRSKSSGNVLHVPLSQRRFNMFFYLLKNSRRPTHSQSSKASSHPHKSRLSATHHLQPPIYTFNTTMIPHSCPHCSHITIDLPDFESGHSPRDQCSTLEFDVDVVGKALRDGCMFFVWASAIDVIGLNGDGREEYVNGFLEGLPGVYGGGDEDEEDGEDEEWEDMEDEIGSKSEVRSEKEEEEGDVDEGCGVFEDEGLSMSRLEVSGDNEETSGGLGKANDQSNKESIDEEEAILQNGNDPLKGSEPATQKPTRPQILLHLESYKMVPGRCRVIKYMTRSDKVETQSHYSHNWEGPELDVVIPGGMSHHVPEVW